ncbi:5-formyltetrahydrofolate cyclo-ligase [Parvimonas micra]|uniref:5-formyltetrahydrofolate cyclo-ligase n=1 Tax=Parvimonas micra TaxID=33033 RepID=A0A9X3HF95_9FIRM|nr:5-formyltetrahydrofolate cyclo-ligase [Parvimonas micra]MCZ7407683.1 5-formyltetrahydrofolate cyclo-ligase [Parvimonas micra]MCZ7410678.1 5-formyltetrahydrofolate cyclo-ligase [Parvimonas micra]MCZ7412600.1 5-formyltetrahydrofolate cyclo-ligase [Parvimonas micra]WBB36343.1 5-formyltetrahydrofolate cyclo-ligase [Parvimonas micra]
MDKKIIRKEIQEKLKKISDKDRKSFEEILYKKLFENENFKNANCIALTIPFGTEINTYPIIEKLLKDGKTACSPICEKESRKMTFYKINSLDELIEGYYGIKTPPKIEENIIKKDEIDLILVPGVGFDKNNYRIGFGGGYYDRYLKDFKGYTISLAFKEQIVEKVPTNEFDLPVDLVITN